MSRHIFSSHTDEYTFPRQYKKRKSRFWILFFVFIGVGFVCIGIAYFLLFGNFWKVSSIRVIGSQHIDDVTIISALVSELHSQRSILNFLGQDNILFWSFRKDIPFVRWIPEIKNIQISSHIFSHTVAITLVERSVRAIVCAEDSYECYAIDDEDIVFSKVPWAEGTLIPRFEDRRSFIILGKKYFRKKEWSNCVYQTLEILQKNSFVPVSISIKHDNSEEWEARLPSGTVFYFNINFVPQNFDEIIKDLIARGGVDRASYFDFRVQNRMYYK